MKTTGYNASDAVFAPPATQGAGVTKTRKNCGIFATKTRQKKVILWTTLANKSRSAIIHTCSTQLGVAKWSIQNILVFW
jgi:hypothetical protein